MVTCAAALIFVLAISNGFAQAKDNQPSPLFKESLKETLKEFNAGTAAVTNENSGRQSQIKGENQTDNAVLTITKQTNGCQSQTKIVRETDNSTLTITKKNGPCQSQTNIERETDNGTVTVTKKTINCPGQATVVKVKVDIDRDPDCKVGDKVKDIIKNAGQNYPTLVGSTCRGVKCNGFPTLVGSTCSVTCGTRSTCSNGRFCRNNPSPCAKADGLNRMAKGSEKPFTFTIF